MTIRGRLINFIGRMWFKRIAGTKGVATVFTEHWLETPWGYKVYAHIHRPTAEGEYPGVVIVPGALSPGTTYDSGTELTAKDIAACGCVVLHYDPSGRGKSNGREDFWGVNHQRELAFVIDTFSRDAGVMADNIGLFSFSIGIAIAVGALARFVTTDVAYLYDWEGPSNRFNITKNNTHKPLLRFPTSDRAFWNEREPRRFIDKITCSYFRYQAMRDHMQGSYKGHAIELVNLAAEGQARWTRVNDNPPDIIYNGDNISEYNWIPFYRSQKSEMLKFLNKVKSDQMYV
jgi:hypothetical protein